jgi:LacI family transcriptional regulator
VKANKEITIYDIADQLGVSPATVSRALSDNPSISISTRNKINSLAEKLGYRHNHFASSLRLQKTHTIGVILHELNSYFITSVLAGIEKIATEAKYNLIIAHSAENPSLEAANARNLFHKRVDGTYSITFF